jgi:hypothetical protein
MTFDEIKEQEPEAGARVEALRQASKDAEGLENHSLIAGLKVQFKAAIESHVAIFMESMNLPIEQHLEIVKSMETRRIAGASAA